MSHQTTQAKDEFIMSTMEDLVPKDHLVRKLIKHVDYTFIRALAKPYYSEIGRPGYDPVILFKIAILKSIFGISSIRRTCEEIKVNIAYRYFLGIPFTENVPDHSTYSKAYTQRFYETDIYEKVFEGFLDQIEKANLIDPTYIFIDSTHIKASANKKKYIDKMIQKEKNVFEQEVLEMINDDRKDRNKKPLPPKTPKDEKKRKKESKTDPDSGWLSKGEKEHNFSYNSHTACDLHGFILGQVLKPSNIHDSQVFKEVFERVSERYEGLIEAAGLDAGYKTGPIIKAIADKQILPLMPYKRSNAKKGDFGHDKFLYDEQENHFTCPNFETLTYQTTNRQGYREYRCEEAICQACPFKKKCLSPKEKKKTLRISVYQDYLRFCEEIRLSEYGKEKYAIRKQTIERDFGDFKERHQGRFTYYRGLKKVSDHVSLTFACMNVKKMALRLSERALKEHALIHISSFISKISSKWQKKKPIFNLKLSLSF
jgi:transposase